MSTRSIVLVMALALTFSACPAPQVGQLSEEDVAAIRSTREAYVQAVLAGDWAAAAALHTDEAVRMPPNAPDVRGRAAIEASLAEIDTVTEFTLTSVEIDGRDGLAYGWQTLSITFVRKGVPGPITATGRGLVTWRKQPDGSWLADRVVWNSDQPLPE